MADNLLNTSIAALKTRVLNEITSANALDVLKLAQASKGSLLHNDTQIETAINTRINSLASSANAGDLKILGLALKQMLDSPASTTSGATTLDELTDVSTSGVANDKILKYNSSTSKWEVADESGGGGGASVSISDTAPSSPSAGDLWFDSTDASMKVYYGDGSSNQWVTTSGETGPTGADGQDGQDGQTGSAGADGGKAEVLTDMAALIAKTGMTSGDMALVNANNNLYIYNGSGWYKIATITNQSPSAITGVSGTYDLTTDGSPTTITAVTTDPEGFPLTWSYTTSGLGSIATVSNTDGVFTITPSTDTNNGGTFTLTISATDGVNGAVSATSNLTLEFIITVPNSRYTTMLAAATSTGDNSSITDSSSYNKTVTHIGGSVVSSNSFSPYRNGGYSMSFGEGTADYVNISGSNNLYTAMDFGTDDYTVECWLYPKLTGNAFAFGFSDSSGTDSSVAFALRLNLSGNNMTIRFQNANDAGTLNLSLEHIGDYNNKWTHVAATRTGGYQKLYINGQEVDSQTDASAHMRTPAHSFSIGRAGDRSAFYYKGYITDLRIVNGTAVYTGNFTPPTERLTAVTNTSLLACHLPYIPKGDGSTNNFSFTSYGNASPKPIGPYDYLEYSTTTHGGSIRSNGLNSGVPSFPIGDGSWANIGTGDFTVECWVNPASLGQYDGVFTGATQNGALGPVICNDNWWLGNNSNAMMFSNVSNILKVNQWQHVAISRTGTTARAFYNGKLMDTKTNSSNLNQTTMQLFARYTGGSYLGAGNIGDFRLLDSCIYTTDFTPPSVPLSSQNAKVHIKGTDASIIDKSQNDHLTLYGNTTAVTDAKFNNTNSISFDGTGDYVSFDIDGDIRTDEDFTVELWFKLTSLDHLNGLFQVAPQILGNAHGQNIPTFAVSPLGPAQSYRYQIYYGTNQYTYSSSTTPVTTGQWYHLAYVRSSGTITVYEDGTEVAGLTISDTTAYTNPKGVIGGYYASGYLATGNIQDFRFTRGLARYTANFTPPAEPLKG